MATNNEKLKGVLVDLTRCIGCRGCQVACKSWNERSVSKTVMDGTFTNPPDLNSDTYTRIAFIEQGLVQHRHFRGRNITGTILPVLETNPAGVDAASLQVRDVIRGRAGHDAVVIVGITLRFGETLLAAGGAAVPVSELRGLAVERLNDELRIDRHFVDGAVGPVD